MSSFNYKKLVKASETWFSPAAEAWMWDDARKDIAEYLEKPGNNYGPLVSIGQVAAWRARLACIAIAKGDLAGWGELASYVDINIRCLRIRVEAARLRGRRAPYHADPTMNPFHLLGMTMALKNWEDSSWLGQTIIEARQTLLFDYNWGGRRTYPFCCYICELFARSTGNGGFPDDFGPYSSIFEHWENPSRLADGIGEACDYHVGQIRVCHPKDIGVFENNPHELFPSEILALYRLREKLGLKTLAVSHPLLDTPFTQVPDQITCEPDPLVDDAIRLALERLPRVVSKL